MQLKYKLHIASTISKCFHGTLHQDLPCPPFTSLIRTLPFMSLCPKTHLAYFPAPFPSLLVCLKLNSKILPSPYLSPIFLLFCTAMASSGSGTGSPCGACKFLRRKCASDCIFAPYFCSEQGPARFAAIHKVFGASNVSKLLLHVPVADRCEAVVTIAYEAQARIRDPVYGCVAHIFALQQQVPS